MSNDFTKKLLKSYNLHPEINGFEKEEFISKENIIKTLHDIIDLVLPGFFVDSKLKNGKIEKWLKKKANDVFEKMAREIEASCKYENKSKECKGCSSGSCLERGKMIMTDFFVDLPTIREMVAFDVKAAYDGDPAAKSFDEIILSYPGFFAIMAYRIAHFFYKKNVPLIPRIISEYAHSITGTDIHPGAEIGKSFFIDHATGVVIGETTVIGENVKIYQGVTLGALSFPKNERGEIIKGGKRHPTIEDGVVIYANATILGGDTVIGRGAVIGGNSWITSSVKAGEKIKK